MRDMISQTTKPSRMYKPLRKMPIVELKRLAKPGRYADANPTPQSGFIEVDVAALVREEEEVGGRTICRRERWPADVIIVGYEDAVLHYHNNKEIVPRDEWPHLQLCPHCGAGMAYAAYDTFKTGPDFRYWVCGPCTAKGMVSEYLECLNDDEPTAPAGSRALPDEVGGTRTTSGKETPAFSKSPQGLKLSSKSQKSKQPSSLADGQNRPRERRQRLRSGATSLRRNT